jgi:hypothetical protein
LRIQRAAADWVTRPIKNIGTSCITMPPQVRHGAAVHHCAPTAERRRDRLAKMTQDLQGTHADFTLA